MRIDYNRLIAETRLECGNPDPHAPSDDLIMMQAGDVAQAMMNRMGNAPPGWSQRYFDLQATPGNDGTFAITEADFSKPVRIHTIDPGNPNHVTRKIDDCDWQNVDEFYRGPKVATEGGHSARVMVFWRSGAAMWVSVVPEPLEPVQYRIWFNTGTIGDPRRGDSAPVPPEFFRYLRSQVSNVVLGHCRWGGKLDADVMAAAQDSITKKLAMSQREWDSFVLTNSVTGSTTPAGYADWYMDGWF
ncbi:MAG TPA: hypothetical protein PKC13_24235 [Blastocatellia bacterium]|nr:hypothetical protein [Blastocatellia bacterium]HMX28717.1 hypothetical protein [Blastocatellia bacterium]HMY71191.1 hypothetical protein [Blastocatellia bacterium]